LEANDGDDDNNDLREKWCEGEVFLLFYFLHHFFAKDSV